MRTGTISINGKKHILCFSLRVMRQCAERYGSVSGLYDALSDADEKKSLDEAVWVLSAMMRAGDKYAKENDVGNEKAMTVEELYDACDISDFFQIRTSIVGTINNGRKTTVEVETPKNG